MAKRGRPQLYAKLPLDALAREVARCRNAGDAAGERALLELAKKNHIPVSKTRVEFYQLRQELQFMTEAK